MVTLWFARQGSATSICTRPPGSGAACVSPGLQGVAGLAAWACAGDRTAAAPARRTCGICGAASAGARAVSERPGAAGPPAFGARVASAGALAAGWPDCDAVSPSTDRRISSALRFKSSSIAFRLSLSARRWSIASWRGLVTVSSSRRRRSSRNAGNSGSGAFCGSAAAGAPSVTGGGCSCAAGWASAWPYAAHATEAAAAAQRRFLPSAAIIPNSHHAEDVRYPWMRRRC